MSNDNANQYSASKTNENYNKVLESNEVKYCYNCGEKVLAKAVVCVHCGVSLQKLPQNNTYEWKPWSSMAMFWLIVGTLFLPFFGEIMGIWSLTVPGRRSQGLALLIFCPNQRSHFTLFRFNIYYHYLCLFYRAIYLPL